MKKEEKVTSTSLVTKYYCDICGAEEKCFCGRAVKECMVCGREACRECSVLIGMDSDISNDFPEYYDDYPSHICKECWERGTDIRKQIMEVRRRAIEDEERLWDMWKNHPKTYCPVPDEINRCD